MYREDAKNAKKSRSFSHRFTQIKTDSKGIRIDQLLICVICENLWACYPLVFLRCLAVMHVFAPGTDLKKPTEWNPWALVSCIRATGV